MIPFVPPRWLRPSDAAAYIGRHRDELPRLVKAGKIPAPSYHFGPRSPRYDRLALDAMMERRLSTEKTADQLEQEAVSAILAGKLPERPKAARGRHS